MAVDFDRDRMEAVLDAHERWWRGELDHPLVKVVLEKDLPRVRALCQANCHEVDRPAVGADGLARMVRVGADRWDVDSAAAAGAGLGQVLVLRLEDEEEFYEPVLEGE